MKLINKTSKKNSKPIQILRGLAHIIDGVIEIVTFGHYWGSFGYNVTKWSLFRNQKNK